MKYENPVIGGFYADPSVCFAEGKYYLVCSSMHYFPSIPLFESVDLVNWTQIGFCLTRKSQIDLSTVPSSGGIFAPTIRYHGGRFYVVTTNDSIHKNFFVYTDDIYGEWSEPVFVEQGGIDPSLYFEKDKVYFTSNGRDEEHVPCIYQCEIDIETGEKRSQSRIIWKGSGGRLVEGPHLYKIKDYYYILAAEGGTEYGHMVTYARSESPWGPFASYEKNPVLTNRNLGDDEIQGVGHGDLIQDQKGNWWLLHLGFRQMALWKQYHHLGREVFLTPVSWDKDEWFTAGKSGTVQKLVDIPRIKEDVVQKRTGDFPFGSKNWQRNWSFLRNPHTENYRFEEGALLLKGTKVSLMEAASPTFIGIRQQEFDSRLTVLVQVSSGEAGVTIFMDEKHHYDLALTQDGESVRLLCRLCIGGIVQEKSADLPTGSGKAQIEICSKRDRYMLRILGGKEITLETEAPSKYLSSEVAGGFTGVLYGLYAWDEKNRGEWSRFTEFKLSYE